MPSVCQPNTGTAVPTSDLESFGIAQLYVTLQLYSFQRAWTWASCSIFTSTSVYSERFRDNLPGLEEPSAAAIPDCFGGVSINRESDARRSVSEKQHTSTRIFYTTSTCWFPTFWILETGSREKKTTTRTSWIHNRYFRCHYFRYFLNNQLIFKPC